MILNLPKEDLELIIEALDYRLYCFDQEYHFFQEEPGSLYRELIEIRDYILSFTTQKESIE